MEISSQVMDTPEIVNYMSQVRASIKNENPLMHFMQLLT